jgi:hypothetical protein
MHDADLTNTIRFKYKFQFDDGKEKEFSALLDSRTLRLLAPPMPDKPEWTKLDYQKCENCPLGADVERCPVAVNLAHLVEEFKYSTSYDKTWVVVEGPERTYAQETSVQSSLASLMGIFMVTSGCPVLDNLRPMVRFHLPFATTLESVYRIISMYLISQMFKMKSGGTPDWNLDGLGELYRQIGKVNKGLWNRLSKASSYDANVNAVIVLNTFGDAIRFSLKKDLEDLAPLFTRGTTAKPPGDDAPGNGTA